MHTYLYGAKKNLYKGRRQCSAPRRSFSLGAMDTTGRSGYEIGRLGAESRVRTTIYVYIRSNKRVKGSAAVLRTSIYVCINTEQKNTIMLPLCACYRTCTRVGGSAPPLVAVFSWARSQLMVVLASRLVGLARTREAAHQYMYMCGTKKLVHGSAAVLR